ncbi:hypothetical protein, partial [Trabulsiella guamensis]|uniref:hypothetical protein n=1 Tax=Trabulsiella guamensis TaxID=158852 RepID=UPI0005702870
KTPIALTVGVFCFQRYRTNEEPVIDFSKLIRELRLMIQQLPTWKFVMLWLVFFVAAVGYLIGQIRWW